MGIAQSQCRSVFLVEDHEVDAYITLNALRGCDTHIAVEVAPSAEEALTKVRNRPYDLIICDFRLPGMNGLSFLKLVKKIRSNVRVIPVIPVKNWRLRPYITGPAHI